MSLLQVVKIKLACALEMHMAIYHSTCSAELYHFQRSAEELLKHIYVEHYLLNNGTMIIPTVCNLNSTEDLFIIQVVFTVGGHLHE